MTFHEIEKRSKYLLWRSRLLRTQAQRDEWAEVLAARVRRALEAEGYELDGEGENDR